MVVGIHSIAAQAPNPSDTKAVSRLAGKGRQGWHVAIQLFKPSGFRPHQFDSV